MIRSWLSQAKTFSLDALKIGRVVIASRRLRIVGYTKDHPIYTDVFEHAPPPGFAFYRRTRFKLLRILDRWVWRRLDLLHLDAATPKPEGMDIPIIVECEGRPRDDFFRDSAIQHVLVESRWAGGDFLANKQVHLLRPSVPRSSYVRHRRAGATEIVLLAVGHGGMVKGLDIVVRIYEALKAEHPIRLIVAGSLGHNVRHYPEISQDAYERADFPAIQRRLASDDRVTVRAWPRRVLYSRIYPAADIYLHLSRLETFGYSILEAMSFELPVIATRLHAIPEMVRHGVTGWLVDAQDADVAGEEWAARVYNGALESTRRLIKDSALRTQMGLAGRRRAAEAFDIEFKRRKLARIYESVLARREPVSRLPNLRTTNQLINR